MVREDNPVKMFDKKGTCKYCEKPTRAKATSLCNACYKLDLGIKNNPEAARKILRDHTHYEYKPAEWYEVPPPPRRGIKATWTVSEEVSRMYNPLDNSRDKAIIDDSNPYSGTRPKENQ